MAGYERLWCVPRGTWLQETEMDREYGLRTSYLNFPRIIERVKKERETLKFLRIEADDGSGGLSIDKFKELMEQMEKGTAINALILLNNGINDARMTHLASMMKNNKSIHVLNVGRGRFTEKGLKELLDSLRNNSDLRDLVLVNSDINGKKMDVLCEFLKSPECKLEELSLSDNNIDDKHCIHLLDALAENKSVLSVCLLSNPFTKVVGPNIKDMLSKNPRIGRLLISKVMDKFADVKKDLGSRGSVLSLY